MATIKSFTSPEQSKRLADILPIESADMCYLQENGQAKTISPLKLSEILNVSKPQVIPCWSLAALLGVLPKRIELEGVAYELSIYLNGLYYWNVNNGNLLLEVKGKDNLLDACVSMIEKLHELNLL